MRIVISLALLIGGVASLVLGISRLSDGSNGSALVVIGIPFFLLGVMMVRRLSRSPVDATLVPASSSGHHSLTEHHERLAHSQLGTDRGPIAPQPSAIPAQTPARAGGFVVVIAVLLAISGAAIAVFLSSNTAAPNVPLHVVSACHDALREAEGPSASFGQPISYDSVSVSFSEVVFETTQEWTWTCLYNIDTGTASSGEVIRG